MPKWWMCTTALTRTMQRSLCLERLRQNFWNISDTAHFYMMPSPKNRINITFFITRSS
jgi:hypothetical protein